MLRGHSRGVLFLVVASLLWSTDSLFRLSAVMQFDSLFVTFLENLIQMVFLLPWLLYRHSKNIFQLSRQEWLCAAVCGVMGAALALVFYTARLLPGPRVAVLLYVLNENKTMVNILIIAQNYIL